MHTFVSRVRQSLRDLRDTRRARRAAAARDRLGTTPVVAVTGSAGKTTTVALLSHILGDPPRVRLNAYSNRPEDVFDVFSGCDAETIAVVLEASEFPLGSLARIADAVRPTAAVLTVAGLDHYVAFRSTGAVAREMVTITRTLPPHGFVVCNADDPEIAAALAGTAVPVVTFGANDAADYRLMVASVGTDHRLVVECLHAQDRIRLTTRFIAPHFCVPVLAAAATAHRLGVSWPDITARVATFEPIFGRCSLLEVPSGPVFICDSAKAPAWSCQASLATLDSFGSAARRTFVFGTLSDYPGDSRRNYRRVLKAAVARVDRVIILRQTPSHVGASADDIAAGRVLFFDTVEQIARHLRDTALPGEAILLKGSSRADHLDRLAHQFVMPVQCWADRCGRGIDCVRCDRMSVGPPAVSVTPCRKPLPPDSLRPPTRRPSR